MLAGQLIVGAVVSTTVTTAVHELDAPLLSVIVKVTVVLPSGYGPAGDWVMVIGSPSGSKDPSSIDAFAMQEESADTVTFLHFATGGWLLLKHTVTSFRVGVTVVFVVLRKALYFR
jgi:hypothetical protein